MENGAAIEVVPVVTSPSIVCSTCPLSCLLVLSMFFCFCFFFQTSNLELRKSRMRTDLKLSQVDFNLRKLWRPIDCKQGVWAAPTQGLSEGASRGGKHRSSPKSSWNLGLLCWLRIRERKYMRTWYINTPLWKPVHQTYWRKTKTSDLGCSLSGPAPALGPVSSSFPGPAMSCLLTLT